jgi:hypothetical protein
MYCTDEFLNMRLQNELVLDVERIALEKIRRCTRTKIPRHVIENLKLEVYVEAAVQDIIIHTDFFLAGSRESTKEVTCSEEVPVSWLDAFRIRFFPTLLVKRYPIKKRRIDTMYSSENIYIFPDIVVPKDSYINNFLVAYSKGAGIDASRFDKKMGRHS